MTSPSLPSAAPAVPIAEFGVNALSYRGMPIAELIRGHSYSDVVFLLIQERMPTPEEEQMFEALLIAWMDHGEPPPSTQNVRNAASVGVDLIPAVCSGLMCFGADHGPVTLAAHTIENTAVFGVKGLGEMLEQDYKIPGFGHPVHSSDPRVSALLAEYSRLRMNGDGKHVGILHDIQRLLHSYGKEVRPNLAGVSAAIWLDLGFTPDTAGVLALAGRSIGMAAHYAEQRSNPKKFKGTP